MFTSGSPKTSVWYICMPVFERNSARVRNPFGDAGNFRMVGAEADFERRGRAEDMGPGTAVVEDVELAAVDEIRVQVGTQRSAFCRLKRKKNVFFALML